MMPASRWRWLLAAALSAYLMAVGTTAATALTADVTASAARVDTPPVSARAAEGWIDGGDDLPCVDDETCLWIEGCKLDGDNNPVYPNHNGTVVGGGKHSYADDTPSQSPSPTQTPSAQPTKSPSAQPTKSPSAQPTKSPTSQPTKSPTSGGSSNPAAPSTTAAVTTDDEVTEEPTTDETETTDDAAPSVLTAPVLTVDGSDVTVTWTAPTGERDDLSGYTVKVLAGPAEQVDASTTSHTFPGLPDGVYAAQVTARYEEGAPETSPVSEKVSLGEDPTTLAGSLTVSGDLVPGERVTVTGAGFAPSVSGFRVELHSDPVVLAEVATDAQGAFQVETTVPDTVVPGEHSVVVVYDNVEVSSTPVTVAEASAATAATASVGTTTAPDASRGGVLILLGLLVVTALVLAGYAVSKRRRPRVEEVRPATA